MQKLAEDIFQLVWTHDFDHVVCTQFINSDESPFSHLLGWHGLLDREEQEVLPQIVQISEQVFPKQQYSCFMDAFIHYAHYHHIDKFYFVGVDTDACILKSAFDAFDHNIPFEVLEEYCMSSGGIRLP